MKKYFRWSPLGKAAVLTAGLSALLALVNLATFDGSIFYIGFPTRFFTLYLDKAVPSFHLNLSGLALDLLLAYAVCWCIKRRKQRS